MQTTAMTDNQQYRDLVEAITTYAIFLVDPLGHVLTWNTGAERITGFASDEVLGAHSSSFQPGKDAARCLEGARAEGVCEQEGWWTRNDGDRFWAEVAVTALRDGSGDVIGFAYMVRDQTAHQAAQGELARLRERERLARDLKTGTMQMMFDVGLSLQSLACGSSEAETRNTLGECIDELDRAIGQLQHCLFEEGYSASSPS